MINKYRYGIGQFSVDFFVFKLFGSDVHSFLQTQTTFEINNLTSGNFHLVSFLDPQGRLESYGWLVHDKDDFYYLVPVNSRTASFERLHNFLVSEDVTVEELGIKTWWFTLGSKVSDGEFRGEVFAEKAFLSQRAKSGIPEISLQERELWRGLSGWPNFQDTQNYKELINNTRLFDLSVVMNKGCYPGQETVSKIATRRGAAYSPVLLESETDLLVGDLMILDKKIGLLEKTYVWNTKYYSAVALLRDFRVEGLKLSFNIAGENAQAIVRYYPLLPGTNLEKAKELFYEATEHFTHDELEVAEQKLKQAIEMDATFPDAYESLGVMLGRMDRFDEAIELMKKLSLVDPNSVLAHTNMSLFLMKQGKIQEAEDQKSLATLKSFQKFGQEAKDKEMLEIENKRQKEEWIKREFMFKQVLEIDAEDTLANYGLGSIAVEKGEWIEARSYLERVLKEDPQYSVAYLALGKAYKALGQIEESKKTWKEGIVVAAKKGDLMPANQMQSELDRF